MFLLFWLLLFYFRSVNSHKWVHNHYIQNDTDERIVMGDMLADLSEDIIKEQDKKSRLTDNARYDNMMSAAYEVGYMTQVIHEHYRKMLAKWQSVRLASIVKMYDMEMVLILEEIEHLYWAIKHEVHMLHEVERKYQIKSAIDDSYEDVNEIETTTKYSRPPNPDFKEIKASKGFKADKFFKDGMIVTTRKRDGPFRLDYGWELYEWNSDT